MQHPTGLRSVAAAAPWRCAPSAPRPARTHAPTAARAAADPARPDPAAPPPSPSPSADLARFLLSNPSLAPPPSSPSPLLSPSEVARAVVEALKRPDYPSPSAGVDTAFAFTLPADTAPTAPVSSGAGRRGRAWTATEAWHAREEWGGAVLGGHPAALLVGGDGEVGFSGAAEITGRAGRHAIVPLAVARGGRRFSLTLCLTRVDEAGPWRGCFLVSGLRAGDYTL